ncbi:MAG: hypothetical protein HQK89_11950 [Nitrospirae bacterium]|nr:hypothetical protein [Nitrospirota bacterium]
MKKEIRQMKDAAYTKLICKPFCEFYSEGKESLLCGTYKYVRDRIGAPELEHLTTGEDLKPDFTHERFIKEEICLRCDFFADGCDYVTGVHSPPCGGYRVVEVLKKKSYL